MPSSLSHFPDINWSYWKNASQLIQSLFFSGHFKVCQTFFWRRGGRRILGCNEGCGNSIEWLGVSEELFWEVPRTAGCSIFAPSACAYMVCSSKTKSYSRPLGVWSSRHHGTIYLLSCCRIASGECCEDGPPVYSSSVLAMWVYLVAHCFWYAYIRYISSGLQCAVLPSTTIESTSLLRSLE